MSTEAMKLQEIMTQAQVFASAWSLVGGRFDGGNSMDEAEVAKNELYQMVAEALAQPQQEPVPAAMKTVIEVMQVDPEYAWSWHCNIAMAFVDAGGDHYTGNQGAVRFMKMLANVEPAHELPSPPAQPQQEPVAWANPNDLQNFDLKVRTNGGPLHTVPLYTSPPAQEFVCSTGLCHYRKPLTDAQIETVWRSVQANDFHDCVKPFARAIEAAHGIKGEV